MWVALLTTAALGAVFGALSARTLVRRRARVHEAKRQAAEADLRARLDRLETEARVAREQRDVARAAHAAAEDRWRAFARVAPLGVIEADETSRVTHANPAAVRLLGLRDASELVMMPLGTLLPRAQRGDITMRVQPVEDGALAVFGKA